MSSTTEKAIETKAIEKPRESEPSYIQFYTDYVVEASCYVTPLAQKLLLKLVQVREEDSWKQELYTGRPIREAICKALGIAESTFFSALNTLVSADILRKRGRGFYVINPCFYARGTWKDVKKRRSELWPDDPTIADSKQEPFVKLYLNDIDYLDKLSKKEFDVLFHLFPHYRWLSKTPFIPIYKCLRKDIARRIGTKERYVAEVIRSLVKKGFLRKLDRNSYQLNPFWFGFGRWPLVRKARVEFEMATEADNYADEKKGDNKNERNT